jgi:F5/8 type C domain
MTILIQNAPTAQDQLPTIIYNNFFSLGTLSATTEAASFPKENAASENTNKSWQPTAIPANLVVDMGSAVAADSFAIVAHNCGTNGNTILLQTSPDNVTYTTQCTVVPTDDTTIVGLFTSVSARYWRIRITTGTPPNIGVAMVSARFNFPAGVKAPYTPVWLSQTYELLVSTTLGGQFMGNKVLRQGAKTAINLVSFDRTFGETTILPFREHYNSGKAFVWAAGPSIFPKDAGYVWRDPGSIMAPTFDENGSWMSVSMEVMAYGE